MKLAEKAALVAVVKAVIGALDQASISDGEYIGIGPNLYFQCSTGAIDEALEVLEALPCEDDPTLPGPVPE